MKKFVLLLVVMAGSLTAMAQEKELVTKNNHITVSYCDFITETFVEALSSGLIHAITDPDGKYKTKSWGSISVTYTHNLSKRWQLGGQVAVGGLAGETLTTIMPIASFDYYRNSWFKISGEAGAGIMFIPDKAAFAFQVYPAVLRFGSDKVAGVIKGGIGTLCFLSAGIQFGF